MPNLSWTSSLGWPPLLGEPGLSLTWLSPPCSTHPLRTRIFLDLLTLSCSPVTAGLQCCNPESAPLGSPFGNYDTTSDAPSLLLLLCWICHQFYTLPGSFTTLLNSPV